MNDRVLKSLAMMVALCALAPAQDLVSFEKRITLKKLDNGLTVIICERPEAPVFSFNTHVDVGSVQDPMGQTGMAHMFEHMAFKGTDTIGTSDYAAEKMALAKVEKAYAGYLDERDKGAGRNDQKLKELQKAWQDAIAESQKYVKPNEFPHILESNGAEGLNANTDLDETSYHYSLPQNRLELWAYLESTRFIHPVMREFYKERNVVIEERRMRTDSNPIGRLLEQFTTAFQAHPYHRPDHWLDGGLEFVFRHRRAALFRRVLHSVEHGGGGRGRRESCRGDARYRKVLWPDSFSRKARRAHHHRTAAEFRAPRGAV